MGTKVTNSRLRAGRRHAPDDDIEFNFLRVTNFFFQSVWMHWQQGTNVSTPKGTRAVLRGDIIRGQHAHTKQHIQRGRTFTLGNEQLAVRWVPHGLHIRAVLPSLMMRGDRVSDWLCKIPTKVFPAGRCLRRRRWNGRLPNYDHWSCPN